jgi:hypothetical protein
MDRFEDWNLKVGASLELGDWMWVFLQTNPIPLV